MRIIPDTITTVADLIDYAKQFLNPEDAAILVRLLERHYDELTRGDHEHYGEAVSDSA